MPTGPETVPFEDAIDPPSAAARMPLWQMALIIIFGIFATTLAQPIVLGNLSLKYILKDTLHADATKISSFFALSALAWYFKPFAGILTDAFPLFGTRRRHYLLISAALAAVMWVVIAIIPKTYASLLYGCVILSAFMVLASTVTGAFLVEAGQRMKATGRLTSVRQTVQNVCGVFSGVLGGKFADLTKKGNFMVVAIANAAIVGSIIPVAWLYLREPAAKRDEAVLRNAGEQIKTILRSRSLWIAIVFLGLFYFVPGFGTVLFLKQSDELKFKPESIGLLGSLQGITGIVAAILYGFLIRRFDIKRLIIMGVILNSVGTFLYLFYNDFTKAALIDSQNNFFFTLCEVSLMDLAARATPKGCEGFGYALILSVRNLAQQMSDVLGSVLHDKYHWQFNWLVYLNAGTTLAVLVLIPFLPAAIMRSRDSALPRAA